MSLLKYTYLFVLCLLGLGMTSSCIYDASDCLVSPEEIPEERLSDVYFSMTLNTNANGTRAEHDESTETDGPGTDAENFINFDELQLLLFNGNQEFLQYLKPEGTPMKNSDGSYEILLRIQDSYFQDNIKAPNIKFYILALANGRSLGVSWLNALRAGAPGPDGTILSSGTKIEDLMKSLQSTTMNVQPVTSKLLKAADSNTPSDQKQYMPMSGIQQFEVSGPSLKATTETSPLELKNLDLLRALAKIEVIDKNDYTGDYFDSTHGDLAQRIQNIDLIGCYNTGDLLPLYNQWGGASSTLSTAQLTAPCIPQNAIYDNPPTFARDYDRISVDITGNMKLSFAKSGNRESDNAPVFSCYMYEFFKTDKVTQPPYLAITVKGTNGRPTTYTVRLAKYTDEEASETDYLTELVRNHIYRYTITHIETVKINCFYTVCPMDKATGTITFN